MVIDTIKKLPRKAMAYGITSILVLVAGIIIDSGKLPTVITGLLAAYSGLVITHTISDTANTKAVATGAK
jgi:hypothetical protein